jgi:hypothetical protein
LHSKNQIEKSGQFIFPSFLAIESFQIHFIHEYGIMDDMNLEALDDFFKNYELVVDF